MIIAITVIRIRIRAIVIIPITFDMMRTYCSLWKAAHPRFIS